MNNYAPSFFRIVQDSLWEDIILHIARLTDSSRTCGNENLSIEKLPELINDNELKKNIKTAIDEAANQSDFCRDWRNRRIAHRDFELATNQTTNSLKPATRKKVKNALKSIAEVLNVVTLYYCDSTTCFEVDSEGPGSAWELLTIINYGLKAQKEKDERIERGEFQEDDLLHENI